MADPKDTVTGKARNLPAAPEIDGMWADEAGRRVAEIERGQAEFVPGEDVFARARRKRALGS